MDSRRTLIIFLLLFFLLSAPDPHQAPLIPQRELQKKIVEERIVLSVLNNSRYDDFDGRNDRWLPLAGLKKTEGFAWGLLPAAQGRARKQLQSVFHSSGASFPDLPPDQSGLEPEPLSAEVDLTQLTLPVYNNVTGKIRGDWIRWKEPESANQPHINYTAISAHHGYYSQEFGRNVTTDNGRVLFDLHEAKGENMTVNGAAVREIKAEMYMETDQSLGESWGVPLYGFHFPATGAITLSTTSEKFAGLPALPHFALSKDAFEASRRLLNMSLSNALQERYGQFSRLLPWTSLPSDSDTITFAYPKCEYIVYLQQHPVVVGNNVADHSTLRAIEEELRFPTGAPIPKPPPMVMSATMFSPDCGFVLETKGPPDFSPKDNLYLSGSKHEDFSKYALRFICVIAAIFALQIKLLVLQMKESSTPSTRSRVSFFTIAMMSMGDALLISFILISLYSETLFLILTATAFLAFVSVSFLGMKFQIEIWTVQAPERRESRPQPPAQNPELPASATPELPQYNRDRTIIPPGENPPHTPTTNDDEISPGLMYARFYFILFSLIFFSSWAMFWPHRLVCMYANTLAFIYLSFWTPQIYRNIMRNCRKALRWDFVLGQSILRLCPFIYIFCVPRNVLLVSLGSTEALVLVLWVWFQNWILFIQDVLGPRFFVPKNWVPPAYDYHPVLRDASASGSGEDLEAGGTLPVSSLRAEQRDLPTRDADRQSNDQRKKKVFDCAICMQDIEVPVLLAPAGGLAGAAAASVTESATNLLSRRAYMVTPCRHIFHSPCLETWMRLRLQCPICRETIPPI